MKKQSVIFLMTIFMVITCNFTLKSQNSIKGNIQDAETKENLEYATVSLLDMDSAFIQGEVANEAGEFSINKVKIREGIIKVSCVGYQTSFLAFKNLTKSISLGTIWLAPTSQQLKEVVVQSEKLRGIDKQIYFPSKEVLAQSSNGLELTQNLLLPKIIVNTQTNSINYADNNKSFKLLINGIEATSQEVLMLKPEDIKRVDYYDNPGLRYGENVGLIIDYIVQRRTSGGFLSSNITETLTHNLGNGQISGGINWGKSQINMYYMFNHNKQDMFTEKKQRYAFPTHTINREEWGTAKWNEIFQMASIAYSYSSSKDILNVRMNTLNINQPHNDTENIIKVLEEPEDSLFDKTQDKSLNFRPSLDVYYGRQLTDNQMLAVNIVGTYNKTQSDYFYKEMTSQSVLSDITSHVKGKRFSFIGEIFYENKLKSGIFSVGLRHTQGYTRNDYTGSAIYKTKMNDGLTYGFAQFKTRLSNWGLLGSVGVSRANFTQEEEDQYTKWAFSPKLSVDYSFFNHFTLRYSYQFRTINPSLSYLSNVEQQKNIYQVIAGNPALKSYFLHSNEFSLNINYPFLQTSLSVNSNYYKDPIMEGTRFNADRNMFITRYDNQKYFHTLSPQLSIGSSFLKNHISINGYAGYNFETSKGNSYKHHYNQWYYVLQAMGNYKKFVFTFTSVKLAHPFWGETVSTCNLYNHYSLSYRFRFGQIGISSMNVFREKSKQTSSDLNEYTRYDRVNSSKHLYPSFAVSLSLNLDWGKSYSTKQKALNNADSQDGIL